MTDEKTETNNKGTASYYVSETQLQVYLNMLANAVRFGVIVTNNPWTNEGPYYYPILYARVIKNERNKVVDIEYVFMEDPQTHTRQVKRLSYLLSPKAKSKLRFAHT